MADGDMNPITWLSKQLDNGWFSRLIMVAIIFFAWKMADWAMGFAGTVLAMEGQKDLMGCAAVIGAVGVLPIGILSWSLSAYMQMRQPKFIEDRRNAAP